MEHPKNGKRNRRMYSGKKKTHIRKHLIVADDRKRILNAFSGKTGKAA